MKLLFVCMGNICRSPTMEGVFRAKAALAAPELALVVDSAGTHDYHIGEPPDRRSQEAARRRGYDLGSLRARQLEAADFEHFDHVLVMDERNLADARQIAPAHHRARLGLVLDFAPGCGRREMPDPYYGTKAAFEEVLDLCEAAALGLIAALRGPKAAQRD
jgi:protein-tyrosine phosphatase